MCLKFLWVRSTRDRIGETPDTFHNLEQERSQGRGEGCTDSNKHLGTLENGPV